MEVSFDLNTRVDYLYRVECVNGRYVASIGCFIGKHHPRKLYEYSGNVFFDDEEECEKNAIKIISFLNSGIDRTSLKMTIPPVEIYDEFLEKYSNEDFDESIDSDDGDDKFLKNQIKAFNHCRELLCENNIMLASDDDLGFLSGFIDYVYYHSSVLIKMGIIDKTELISDGNLDLDGDIDHECVVSFLNNVFNITREGLERLINRTVQDFENQKFVSNSMDQFETILKGKNHVKKS